MIVIDASVVVAALLDDQADGAVARNRMRGARLAAPELIDLEVLSVVRRLLDTERVPEARCRQAVSDLADIRLERAPHRPLVWRIWELRHAVTAYDAAYVALAEALGATLVTADARLADASGATCDVEVLSGAAAA